MGRVGIFFLFLALEEMLLCFIVEYDVSYGLFVYGLMYYVEVFPPYLLSEELLSYMDVEF